MWSYIHTALPTMSQPATRLTHEQQQRNEAYGLEFFDSLPSHFSPTSSPRPKSHYQNDIHLDCFTLDASPYSDYVSEASAPSHRMPSLTVRFT